MKRARLEADKNFGMPCSYFMYQTAGGLEPRAPLRPVEVRGLTAGSGSDTRQEGCRVGRCQMCRSDLHLSLICGSTSAAEGSLTIRFIRRPGCPHAPKKSSFHQRVFCCRHPGKSTLRAIHP